MTACIWHLHQSWSLHGKATSYNYLEGIYANAVANEVEGPCVDSCNGCQVCHPSQRQHDCLMMNENERWQMYGLQAIGRGMVSVLFGMNSLRQ